MIISEQRAAALKSANDIVENAKALRRDLSDGETSRVTGLIEQVKGFDVILAAAAKSADTTNALLNLAPSGALAGHSSSRGGSKAGFLSLKGADAAQIGKAFASRMHNITDNSDLRGAKALADGSIAASVSVSRDSVVQLGQIPNSLLEVLPVVQHNTPSYAYLSQTARANNAAVVLAGGLKPTSVFSTATITDTLKVVAHLSEPVDKYVLSDIPMLAAFLQSELLYGLVSAVQSQILNGNGTAGNMTGLLNRSGVQVQPLIAGATAGTSDFFATTRQAITKLEAIGLLPGAFVISPTDWQTFELSKDASGRYYLPGDGSPVDRAARTLWGVPVVVTPSIATGTALLLDLDAAAIDTDTDGIQLAWNDYSGFDRNQRTARLEGRWNVSCYRPLGLVKIALV